MKIIYTINGKENPEIVNFYNERGKITFFTKKESFSIHNTELSSQLYDDDNKNKCLILFGSGYMKAEVAGLWKFVTFRIEVWLVEVFPSGTISQWCSNI